VCRGGTYTYFLNSDGKWAKYVLYQMGSLTNPSPATDSLIGLVIHQLVFNGFQKVPDDSNFGRDDIPRYEA
jgi:hypothetical protein